MNAEERRSRDLLKSTGKTEREAPSELLAAIRRGEAVPPEVARYFGEQRPGEFFRDIIEPLADSFDPAQAAAYEALMGAWVTHQPARKGSVPENVDAVYVLSRVTLGADIKITSAVLDTMKKRFPQARVVLVSNGKSAELFERDARVEWLDAEYPRSGPVSTRLEFAHKLRAKIAGDERIVVDPDSRMTQLGLLPVCEPENYFHFASRNADGASNLSDLVNIWLRDTFGEEGEAYIEPTLIPLEGDDARAAVSFGVGENEAKRFGGDFEARVIRELAGRFGSVWVDRGVGGEEAARVTTAVEAAGALEKVRFWEASFAGFASVISQCRLYVGYDSAGQHAAAACRVPVVTFFRGASSARFRERWAAKGRGRVDMIDADSQGPEECLRALRRLLE